jgi:hypothetical protein
MTQLLDFLRGDGQGPSGYYLHDVLRYSNDEFELQHDFIQWVFPTDQPSNFNPDAPVLTPDEIKIIRADPHLRGVMGVIYHRWLRFCGLRQTDTGLEFGTSEYPTGNQVVWGRFNHNMLRMTRVLQSLNLLGLRDRAEEFYNFLLKNRAMFTENTFGYFTQAMGGTSDNAVGKPAVPGG